MDDTPWNRAISHLIELTIEVFIVVILFIVLGTLVTWGLGRVVKRVQRRGWW